MTTNMASSKEAEALVNVEHIKTIPAKDIDRDADSGSGSENGEKPVREKLKHTDLEEDEKIVDAASLANGSAKVSELAKLKKKRSFENVVYEDETEPTTPSEGVHARKKTREASGLKISETSVMEKEVSKPSDDDSDKIVIATPPSSTDEPMIDSTPAQIKKKRSSDEMLGSQDILRSPKVAATDKERERRSSSAPLSDEETAESKDMKSAKVEPPRSVPAEETTAVSATTKTIPATSGFSNTSSVSPFASLASGTTQKKAAEPLLQTSASAFAGSGFAALASSGSAFGSLAKAKPPPTEDKPQTSGSAFAASGFGALTGTASPFAAASGSDKPALSFGGSSGFGGGSAFGGGGSAFGSGFGGFGAGSKISSFAAPVSDLKSSATAAKPFGAADDSDPGSEAEDSDGDEAEGGEGHEVDTADAVQESTGRFKIQKSQGTGEEGESTAFTSAQAKLWQFNDKAWIERGKGPFKLNYKLTGESGELEPEYADQIDWDDLRPGQCQIDARLLMRNAATHKVIINARIFKEMSIGDPGKLEEPGDNPKQLAFIALGEDGKPSRYLLSVGKKENLKDLYNHVKAIQKLL